NGIVLSGNGGNVIQGNYVGIDLSGTVARANGASGVLVQNGSANNTIGGTTPAVRNIISGNVNNGVTISGAGTTGNLVQGNYMGTNVAGTGAVPNCADGGVTSGVFIIGASGNTIGGATDVPGTGAGNVVSGNGQRGITVFSGTGNLVAGNIVGLKAAGTA